MYHTPPPTKRPSNQSTGRTPKTSYNESSKSSLRIRTTGLSPTEGKELSFPQSNSIDTLHTVSRKFSDLLASVDSEHHRHEKQVISPSNNYSCGLARGLSMDSVKSICSSVEYFLPHQTIIIFDWDDTLYPSFYLKTNRLTPVSIDGFSHVPLDIKRLMENLVSKIELLLTKCVNLGKVVIVTNAETGWIELCISKFFPPDKQHLLDEIHVCSARSTFEPSGIVSPAGWKTRAFDDLISKFYSQYIHQSWKNVISIGDSPHERDAVMRVTANYNAQSLKKCKVKNIRLKLKPSIREVISQLEMILAKIDYIVVSEDDIDCHLLEI